MPVPRRGGLNFAFPFGPTMNRTLRALPILFARRRDDHAPARLDELCEVVPVDGSQEELVFWLVRWVAWVRPRAGEHPTARVRFFAPLETHAGLRERVAGAFTRLFRGVDLQTFLAYGGIPKDFHLVGALMQWVSARALPGACRTDDVEQIICLALLALPIEIRHVTVSTGSVAVALATGAGSRMQVASALVGVFLVGLVNVAVSFALSLWFALRAADDERTGWLLARVGLRRAFARSIGR
jgi:site-specific recombinase